MGIRISLCLLCIGLVSPLFAQKPIPLHTGPSNHIELTTETGTSSIRIAGETPHFWTKRIPTEATLETHPILRFEYFSTEPIAEVEIRVPLQEKPRSIKTGTLSLSEAWKECAIDLRLIGDPYQTGDRQHFAFSFRKAEIGQEFKIRGIALRPPNAEEQRSEEERAERNARRAKDSAAYEGYLDTDFSGKITQVKVEPNSLVISGRCDSENGMAIRELRPSAPSHHHPTQNIARLSNPSQFEISLPRFDGKRDRATSRWKLYDPKTGTPLSHAAYPSEWAKGVQAPLEKIPYQSLKGLGGIPALTPNHEIFDLGIHHATVNIVLNAFVSSESKPKWTPFTFGNHTLYSNPAALSRLDQNVQILSDKGLVVSAILLVGNNRDEQGLHRHDMIHPEALAAGKFAMPDLTSAKSALPYEAVISLLTERYTRSSEKHGRISNWIIHNEIDQSGTWTNMGDQPLPRYLETYIRSLRLVHQSARLHDPHARAFVSLTHHWTKQSGGPQTFVVRDIVEQLAKAMRLEADCEWGVAYHPYPQPMRQPDAWNNEVGTDFDTEYITPKNIDVLVRFLEQDRFRFNGKTRGILLSEQGVNALSLSEEDQKLQAAGVFYVMDRVRQFPQIEAFHFHAYQDNPEAEGGLLLGLRNREAGHKMAWDIYKAIGTDREAELTKFTSEYFEPVKATK